MPDEGRECVFPYNCLELLMFMLAILSLFPKPNEGSGSRLISAIQKLKTQVRVSLLKLKFGYLVIKMG